MKKLNLDLNELTIETFATGAEEAPLRGTVHGHATYEWNGCTAYEPCKPVSDTDFTEAHTCNQASCYGTCGGSCGGTCYQSCNCPTNQASCHWTCQETTPC